MTYSLLMLEAQERSKTWFIVALCLLVLVGGYFFAEWLIGGREVFRGAAPNQPPVPLIAPVAEPSIKKYEEIAQYTGGKPLPSAPGPGIFLTPLVYDEHLRGDAKTAVTMVEYAPLTNKYARVLHTALKKFFEANQDRMHWVFRHYPGTDNEDDYRAGIATECVAQQLGNDAFWSYLDLLMAENGTLPLQILLSRGTEVGADSTLLQSCIEKRDLYSLVIDDKESAQVDSQVYVTPTFVFRNRRTNRTRIVEGINTVEYLQAVLDDVLNRTQVSE